MLLSPLYISLIVLVAVITAFSILCLFQRGRFKRSRQRYRQLVFDLNNEIRQLKGDNEKLKQKEKHLLDRIEEFSTKKSINKEEFDRLDIIANNTDSAVMVVNVKGEIEWANAGFEKLHGLTLGEFKIRMGKTVQAVSTYPSVAQVLDKAMSSRLPQTYTSKVEKCKTDCIWLKTVVNPIFDKRGVFIEFVIIDTDITALTIANANLKRLSLVASKSNNPVLLFDNRHRLDWVNEGFKKFYNIPDDNTAQVFGVDISSYFKAHNRADILEEIDTQKKERVFVSLFNWEGNEIWKQVRVIPVDDEENLSYIIIESDITRIKEAEKRIQEEKDLSEKLLLNILPEETAEELKTKGEATPRFYRKVSVLFADFVGFSKLSEQLTPVELVEVLQQYFSHFDNVVVHNFVEKIKTIGDAYMCVGGVPMRNKSHPFNIVLVALEFQRIVKSLAEVLESKGKTPWVMRIGIHTGAVVAGVVGTEKMVYDIWGDSVNIAKRIESACIPGTVNVSATTYEVIKDYFDCEHRGKILAKNKGHIDMYRVYNIKPEFSENGEGLAPNQFFKEMLAQL